MASLLKNINAELHKQIDVDRTRLNKNNKRHRLTGHKRSYSAHVGTSLSLSSSSGTNTSTSEDESRSSESTYLSSTASSASACEDIPSLSLSTTINSRNVDSEIIQKKRRTSKHRTISIITQNPFDTRISTMTKHGINQNKNFIISPQPDINGCINNNNNVIRNPTIQYPNGGGSGSANNNALVISSPPPSQQTQQQQQQQKSNDDWTPYAISDDYKMFKRYGVDPKTIDNDHDCSGTNCFGCGMHSDKNILKNTNMELFVQRMINSGLQNSDLVSRSEMLYNDYNTLIKEPSERLKNHLNELNKQQNNKNHCNEGDIKDNDDDDDEYEELYDGCSIENMQTSTIHSNHKNSYQQNVNRQRHSNKSNNDVNTKNGLTNEEWNVVQVYNHIKRHTANPVEEIAGIKSTILKCMEELSRGSLFLQHSTKKDQFGNPLIRGDSDQFKIFFTCIDKYMLLMKSNPEKMLPFFNPSKSVTSSDISSGTAAVHGRNTGELVNLTGQLLFTKKKNR